MAWFILWRHQILCKQEFENIIFPKELKRTQKNNKVEVFQRHAIKWKYYFYWDWDKQKEKREFVMIEERLSHDKNREGKWSIFCSFLLNSRTSEDFYLAILFVTSLWNLLLVLDSEFKTLKHSNALVMKKFISLMFMLLSKTDHILIYLHETDLKLTLP